MNRRRLTVILGWLLAANIPFWLTLTSIRLLMTEPYLQIAYSTPGFPPDFYGMTMDERREYAPFAIRYLLNDQGVEYLGDLTFPDGSPMYNERELGHMDDVKTVVQAAFTAHLLLTAGMLVVGLILFRQDRPALRGALRNGGIVTLGIVLALIGLVIINWDFFFDSFHQLFFESGTWRFEYTDTLIRLFPEYFWFTASITIGVLVVVGALALIGVSWLWARRANDPPIPNPSPTEGGRE